MGCWNGTCGVSRLPIYAGDPVVLYPLLEEVRVGDMSGGFCYTYDRAQPLTIGVRGTYNDYGGIQDLQGVTLPLVEKFFSENADKYVDEEGEPFELDFSDLESVLNDGIERGELYNTDRHYGGSEDFLRPLGLMMVHAGLHDKLVAQIGKESDWRAPTKTIRETMSARLSEVLSPALKREDPELEQALRDVKLMQALRGLSSLVAKEQQFTKHFIEAAASADETLREATLEAVVDLLLFNEALTFLRTPWAVQCGAGSQTGYSDLHKTLAEDMVERIQAYEAEMAEEDDDE
jgi:hypothetical protein